MAAATVVTHGLWWSTVEAAGPEFPAEADTKIPAEAADRNASSTGSAGSGEGSEPME